MNGFKLAYLIRSLMTGSYQDSTDVQLEHASIIEDKLKNYHNDNRNAYLK